MIPRRSHAPFAAFDERTLLFKIRRSNRAFNSDPTSKELICSTPAHGGGKGTTNNTLGRFK